MIMTREEPLKQLKERALEYIDDGYNRSAYHSMMSGLRSHEETEDEAAISSFLGLIALKSGDNEEMRKFINSFN